jgi:hypothetical protein
MGQKMPSEGRAKRSATKRGYFRQEVKSRRVNRIETFASLYVQFRRLYSFKVYEATKRCVFENGKEWVRALKGGKAELPTFGALQVSPCVLIPENPFSNIDFIILFFLSVLEGLTV